MYDIQWFPGHMTKSMRMMEENIKYCDGVLYVLDARAPLSCINKNFDFLKNKKIIYLLNKCDLADNDKTKKFLEEFNKTGVCISIDGRQNSTRAKIISTIKKTFEDFYQKNKNKGVNKSVKLMVVGVPNTGKSTIINTLAGSKKAVTGNKAGVTRDKQWVRFEGIELLDTPGTMPHKQEQVSAKNLAYIGSINDDILDFPSLTVEFLEKIKSLYPTCIKDRYKVENEGTGLEVFESICKARGFIMKNGFDYERGARAIIGDFRKGSLGKITLDE